jgi:hypothetical protein
MVNVRVSSDKLKRNLLSVPPGCGPFPSAIYSHVGHPSHPLWTLLFQEQVSNNLEIHKLLTYRGLRQVGNEFTGVLCRAICQGDHMDARVLHGLTFCGLEPHA